MRSWLLPAALRVPCLESSLTTRAGLAELARHGATTAMIKRMQTRSELYALIGLEDFEALDATIAASVPPARYP